MLVSVHALAWIFLLKIDKTMALTCVSYCYFWQNDHRLTAWQVLTALAASESDEGIRCYPKTADGLIRELCLNLSPVDLQNAMREKNSCMHKLSVVVTTSYSSVPRSSHQPQRWVVFGCVAPLYCICDTKFTCALGELIFQCHPQSNICSLIVCIILSTGHLHVVSWVDFRTGD